MPPSKGKKPDPNRIIVAPRGDDWTVSRANAARASAVKPTQVQAERRAKQLARNTPGGAEVQIRNAKGKIIDSDTIDRRDPNPPRDKKH